MKDKKENHFMSSFFSRIGLDAHKIPESNVEGIKSPDLLVEKVKRPVILCENKAINTKFDDYGLPHNRVFNKLTSDLDEAVKQFNCFDPKHSKFNLVALISYIMEITHLSIFDFLSGKIEVDDVQILSLRKFTAARNDLVKTVDAILFFSYPSKNPAIFLLKKDRSAYKLLHLLGEVDRVQTFSPFWSAD